MQRPDSIANSTSRTISREEAIVSELVRFSHRTPFTALLLNIPAAAAVAALHYKTTPLGLLVLWLAFFSIATLVRLAHLLRFRAANPPDPIGNTWRFQLMAVMAVFGFAWGSSVWFLDAENVFLMQIATGAVIVLTAIFMMLSIPWRPAFLAFLACSMLPLIGYFLLQGTTAHAIMGVLLIILSSMANMMSAARQSAFHELTSLRFELAEKKEAAEQANLAKSRFLAAASHDLRQPLHALSLFAGMLDARLQGKDEREIVNSINHSVTAVENLLNALLDISRLDAGAVIPKREVFPLGEMLARLADEYEPQARAKGLKLVVESPDAGIESDPTLLETILRNLLSNAIRYTNEGSVTLRVHTDHRRVQVEITDTGVGIPMEHREDIFREFHQLHNPERDRSKGLGLGLAIVKRLTQLLGHPLTLQSVPGQGSTFVLGIERAHSIPAQNPAPSTPVRSEEALPAIRVLVIDDEASIRHATAMLLESWGIPVDTVESAEAALARIAETGLRPDAIIADYRLRDGATGVEAILRIHAQTGHRVPAVIMTGDTAPERLKEIDASGFGVLHKPVSPARIRAFVQKAQRRILAGRVQ